MSDGPIIEMRNYPTHGHVRFRKDRAGSAGRKYFRCVPCAVAYVGAVRTKNRLKLVQEKGGRCQRCGYDRYIGALEFHHRDPATKLFAINAGTGASFKRMRDEAAKCDLLCANCHREVEVGLDWMEEAA